jgi:hypothetical protein
VNQEQFELGGRVFEPVPDEDTTFEQFSWMSVAMDKAGVGDEMVDRLEPYLQKVLEEQKPDDKDKRAIANFIINRCMQNAAHLDVLAGSIREVGQEWDRASAIANREFFAKCKGKDVTTLAEVMQQIVVAFFWTGLNSILTSPKYSLKYGVGAMEVQEEEESGQESDSESSEK